MYLVVNGMYLSLANLSYECTVYTAFSRAIVKDPKIFVLDEATSSIDTETEMIIQKTIENVSEVKTSFVIS